MIAVDACCREINRPKTGGARTIMRYRSRMYLQIVCMAILLFAKQSMLFADVIGITYNPSTKRNEIYRIDLARESIYLLNIFQFDDGGWAGGLAVDAGARRFYAQSGMGTLYTFSLSTGEVLSTHTVGSDLLQEIGMRPDGLLFGIRYNSTWLYSEFYSINPANGDKKLLNHFTFDGGAWVSEFAVDPLAGRAYAQSGGKTLLTFDIFSGAVLARLPMSKLMQDIVWRDAGSLIGINYNYITSRNEVYSIDLATGAQTLLNSLRFSADYWRAEIAIDRSINRFYAQAADGTLYTFDLTTGAILSTRPMPILMQEIYIYEPSTQIDSSIWTMY